MSFLILNSEPHGRLPEGGNPILDYLMQFSFFSTLFIIIAVVVFVVMTYALIKIIIDPINKNTREFNLRLKNYSPKNPNYSQRNTIIKVTSPMTGNIFFTPAPNSPPFIKVGQKIKKGDIIFIVDAMKLFNEITSETSGEIVGFLVEEGQAVQYGEPILEIKII